MQFTRLRLQGFKSFVDPTELLIEPGLTGIVGPNGCGKSNLVEALQWVMGEGSARRLRGGDMDDVIFAGTVTRAGKASASACLDLSEAEQRFDQNSDDLEIERRIVRGKGSTYRVNGKEQRARDVQTLFADAASGAQSISLIGQGRIGWLINAKPTERRSLLEEAAGIAGLQTRRREAETKLTAAEANLVRLEDTQAGLIAQIERLKKQARTAERYKKLSQTVTQYEAALLYLQWSEQVAQHRGAEEQLATATRYAAETADTLTTSETAKLSVAETLAPLRDCVSAAQAVVAQHSSTLLSIEAERQRAVQQLAQARQRLTQSGQDAARETALAEDAGRALISLQDEAAALTAELDRDGNARRELARLIEAAKPDVAAHEETVVTETGKLAADKAALVASANLIASITNRLKQLNSRAEQAAVQVRILEGQQVPDTALAAAETEIAAADAALGTAATSVERAAQDGVAAEQARQQARERLNEAERRSLSIQAEIGALQRVLAKTIAGDFPPMLDLVQVEPGYEIALGAALGDDLLASSDESAPRHWRAIDGAAVGPLPAGAEALEGFVAAPATLARRLAAVGLVSDEATALRLQPFLLPGQRLVSRDGSLWRWDGLAIAANAASPAAVRLEQRNRLGQAESASIAIEAALSDARDIETNANARYLIARDVETRARATQLETTQKVSQLRRTHITLLQAHTNGTAKLRAAYDLRERLEADSAAILEEQQAADGARAALPDQSAAEAHLVTMRDALRQAREILADHQRRADFIDRDIGTRRVRLSVIATEMVAWQDRQTKAAAQQADQAQRRALLEIEIGTLADRPETLAADHQTASANLATARDLAATALDDLRAGESRLTLAEQAHGDAQQRHGDARERLIRAESAVEHTAQLAETGARLIRDRFDCRPEALLQQFPAETISSDAAPNDIERRIGVARRDRDALGPVNLMAESELTALSSELELIQAESADLVSAIAKLRQAISQINHEGRARLQVAFDAVNHHFQTLFVRLFGGGGAHLELSFADGDPLAAGLEIMASPPGKKPQILSLLSGGERALTALALIFAAFLANPAPICVLDEVDAPLDDANVERFCVLVRDIAEQVATRFLIVTHHRVTMARMDRLYGVTMMERGISRLVSVELQAAQQMRRTA